MSKLRNPTVIALAGLVVLLGAVLLVQTTGSSRDEQNVEKIQRILTINQRAACERGKLDRREGAAGWRAHATYINSVTQAASVKEDVKRAARKAQKTYRRVARALTKRSKINCVAAFPLNGKPAPSLTPTRRSRPQAPNQSG